MFDESEFPGGVDWLSEEKYNMLKEKTMTTKKKKKKVKKKKRKSKKKK
tara:strand:- start:365 stop:508 length:144 start_codon:yes stop_codon:yes gene_type:complete